MYLCVLGRFLSTAWACSDPNKAMQKCMKAKYVFYHIYITDFCFVEC